MEVIHPILGLVKTSVILTLFQVASRLFLIWGVLSPVPKTQNSWGFIMLLAAWTVTEIIRYRWDCNYKRAINNSEHIRV